MFLVARRTKFRVVEKALDNGTPTSTYYSTPDTRHSPIPTTHQAPSSSTAYPESLTSSSTNHDQPAPESTPAHPPPSQDSQPANAPPTSIPNFSLQSYIRMAQGLPSQEEFIPPTTISWAQQLQRDGVLQTSNRLSHQQARYKEPTHHKDLPLTSTPLNPADVPAEELHVYWEDPCKPHRITQRNRY